jgi:hypothetical protein
VIWKKIRELALVAGHLLADQDQIRTQSTQSQSPVSPPVSLTLLSQDTLIVTQYTESPPRKKKRRSLAATMEYASPESVSLIGNGSPARSQDLLSVSEQVDSEIQDYKTLGATWKHGRVSRSLVECTVIEWWCKWGCKDFPILSKVALAIFGVLPGSGGLECDIGGFKDVIGPKGSRLDPAAVEMHLVVDKNKDLLELDPRKQCQLPEKNWEQMYPTRPPSPIDYYVGEDLERTVDRDPLELSYTFIGNRLIIAIACDLRLRF